MRVFLISALPAVRVGLRALLASAGDLEIVGEAATLEALASNGSAFRGAAVVVVDAPPDASAADLAPIAVDGAIAPIVLGPIAGARRLAAALHDRAWAYLPRDTSGEALVAAVRAAGAGLAVVDPVLAAAWQSTASEQREEDAAGAPFEPLTPREREVLQLVALGLPNKQIARRLGISDHTAKFHVAAVLAKLGAGSRTEAVNVGLRRGLVAL